MAFVPDFECDVFLSYATADDQSFAKDKRGWVSHFRDALKISLDQRLGRRGASEVWMDYKLRGNDPFDEQLRSKLARSATLLIVLSEAYLKSDWCRREVEAFVEAAGGADLVAGRIFLAQYEPVLPQRWPSSLSGLSDLKYRFFTQDRDGEPSVPLGFPLPHPGDPAHAAFYTRLHAMLAPELAQKLHEMAAQSEQPVVESHLATAYTAPTGPAVFLAEVYGDTLNDQREMVASHLQQSGLRVFPVSHYSRNPAAFAQEMQRDLVECVLLVQMLGARHSPRTADLPSGYEGLQHEQAVATGMPVLRWRSRDLVLESIADQEHRRLLDGADVQAMDLDELKRTIVDRVRVLSAKRPAPAIAGERFVLINAAAADIEIADSVLEQLAAWNVGYDVVDDTASLQDLLETQDCDALLVIYGQSPHDWVRQQLIECRKILLTKKTRAPACAVYIGPPPLDQKEPLRYRLPRMAVIDPRDESQLQAFIANLPAQEVTA